MTESFNVRAASSFSIKAFRSLSLRDWEENIFFYTERASSRVAEPTGADYQ